jgi:hypothetical protein
LQLKDGNLVAKTTDHTFSGSALSSLCHLIKGKKICKFILPGYYLHYKFPEINEGNVTKMVNYYWQHKL